MPSGLEAGRAVKKRTARAASGAERGFAIADQKTEEKEVEVRGALGKG